MLIYTQLHFTRMNLFSQLFRVRSKRYFYFSGKRVLALLFLFEDKTLFRPTALFNFRFERTEQLCLFVSCKSIVST